MRNKTQLTLPFNGKWIVEWGGKTIKLNYHRNFPVQRDAIDFIGLGDNKKSYKGRGAHNEDYYVFGKEVLAPADGEVIEVVTGIRDNKPGYTNLFANGGNYLLIKHRDDEYSFIAHLRQNTTEVKEGDKVKRGQKLGECGNSGNSSEPHIHYHLQTSDTHSEFGESKPKPVAKGIRVYFSNVAVEKNGNVIKKKLHSPVKGDVIYSINTKV